MNDAESKLVKRQARIKAALGDLPADSNGDVHKPGGNPKNPKMATSAEGHAAIVALSFLKNLELPPQGVYDEIRNRTDAVQAGSMDVPERMLMSQALALQAVFAQLMSKASNTNDIKRMEPLMRLALKAQSNCRVTLETLNEFKNPRSVAFVRQTNVANVANGPQQVNFSAEPGRALKRARGKSQTGIKANELLEETSHVKGLDAGAQRAPIGADSKLGTLGKIHRPKQPTGQEKELTKRNSPRAVLAGVA